MEAVIWWKTFDKENDTTCKYTSKAFIMKVDPPQLLLVLSKFECEEQDGNSWPSIDSGYKKTSCSPCAAAPALGSGGKWPVTQGQ